MFRAWNNAIHLITTAALVWCGISTLTSDAPWLNVWLRAGIAVGFFSHAIFHAAFRFSRPPEPPSNEISRFFVCSLQTSFSGYALAGLLIAIGLFLKNTAGGYVGAYFALALVWFFGWFVWWSLKTAEASTPQRR